MCAHRIVGRMGTYDRRAWCMVAAFVRWCREIAFSKCSEYWVDVCQVRRVVVVWRWAGVFVGGEQSGDAGTNVGADLGTGMKKHVESHYDP
jgi:hypothetical protein